MSQSPLCKPSHQLQSPKKRKRHQLQACPTSSSNEDDATTPPTATLLTPTLSPPLPFQPTLPPNRHPTHADPSPMISPYALLLASLGNPPPHHTTRHSAAHILLRALALHLSAPPLQRSKTYAGGLVTHAHLPPPPSPSSSVPAGGRITLWQSPTLMNTSGPAVLSAWRGFGAEHALQSTSTAEGGAQGNAALGLVVLHDELEMAPGTLRVKRGLGGSVKGHNGLRSVVASLRGAGLGAGMEGRVVRVGVGIGRPAGGGRGREEVSEYVLGKVTEREREGIEGLVGRLVEVLGKEGERIAGGR